MTTQLSIDHAALAGLLERLDRIGVIPAADHDWSSSWQHVVRHVIDATGEHPGLLIHNLPAGPAVALYYDELADPVGLQVSVQASDLEGVLCLRIVSVDYDTDNPPQLDSCDTPAAAVAALLTRIVADLDFAWTALRLVHGIPVDSENPERRALSRPDRHRTTSPRPTIAHHRRKDAAGTAKEPPPMPSRRTTRAEDLADAIHDFTSAAVGISDDEEHAAASNLAECADAILDTRSVRVADYCARLVLSLRAVASAGLRRLTGHRTPGP